MEKRQKIPLKLKFIRFKNSGFFSFIDKFIYWIKPPRKIKHKPLKILFFRNDKIGDAIVTLPVLRDLKLNYPEIQIHLICSARNKFVFENIDYIDKLIVYSPAEWYEENLSGIYKIPIVGKLLQFLVHFIIPYFGNTDLRQFIEKLKAEKYDAVIDLIGRRRIAFIGKIVSEYTAGCRLFGLSWLNSYYLSTNWVSEKDTDFISRKIQFLLEDSLNLKLSKKNKQLPYFDLPVLQQSPPDKEIDVFIHLGSADVRKFEYEKELAIIESLKNYRLIVTESSENENYFRLKEHFKDYPNIEFKPYHGLHTAIPDVKRSKLMLCYDGGQAHYLSQFVTTIVIFSTVPAELWKPYEFEDYHTEKEWKNGLRIIQSAGNLKHQVIYRKIWCSPCFDVGCIERPCLGAITPEIIFNSINKKLSEFNDNKQSP